MFTSPEPSLIDNNSNIYFQLERSSDSWLAIESLKKNLGTDSIKFQISSKTSHGKKYSTQKRRHQRHHQRQPDEHLFPIQLVTGKSNNQHKFLPIFIFIYNKNNDK